MSTPHRRRHASARRAASARATIATSAPFRRATGRFWWTPIAGTWCRIGSGKKPSPPRRRGPLSALPRDESVNLQRPPPSRGDERLFQQHQLFGHARVQRDRRVEIGLAQSRLRSEEHTSELQSLMRISYAVFCLKKKKEHI